MKKEIICMICGFSTTDFEDMIKHLSCTQKYKEENCTKKVLLLKKLKGEKE